MARTTSPCKLGIFATHAPFIRGMFVRALLHKKLRAFSIGGASVILLVGRTIKE